MTESNFLNVYKGADSVRKYFDPDSTPPLPLVEIPDCLNPYRRDGVRIYAKMMTMHPANNVKSMPALNLLEKGVIPNKTDTIIEYSSGSTVISMSLISRVFYGISDVRAFLSNKTAPARLRLMQFFGLNITLFGGPSQPEPIDERGGIRVAQTMAQEADNILNPNQYENDDNWKSHIRWTGPQIFKQLPEINMICAGLGTSGTMTGLGTYFKTAKPSVFRLGVCTQAGDRVPGPRSHALLAPVEFPWKEAVDHLEHVGSYDSFTLSLELCRQGIVCGPSSGFNLQGLCQFIEKRKADSNLPELAGEDGEIHCVFLCCDLPYQYISEYFDKLGPEHFPTITNESLTQVDLYRYDEAWELRPSEALAQHFKTGDLLRLISKLGASESLSLRDLMSPNDNTCILDLRQPDDFEHFNLPGSINVPFAKPTDASPFFDPSVLSSLWLDLESRLGNPDEQLLSHIRGNQILLVCYDGDSSRVAASVLRAKGYAANSVRGGIDAMCQFQDTMSQDSGYVGTPDPDYKTHMRVATELEVLPSP